MADPHVTGQTGGRRYPLGGPRDPLVVRYAPWAGYPRPVGGPASRPDGRPAWRRRTGRVGVVPPARGGFHAIRAARGPGRAHGDQAAGRHVLTVAQPPGVLVRHYMKPGLENYIRVSAGRPQDTDALLAALARLAPC